MTVSEHRYILKCIENLKDQFSKEMTMPNRQQTKVWRYMLLNNKDTVVVDGKVRQITAKSIGAGVYELTLKEIVL